MTLSMKTGEGDRPKKNRRSKSTGSFSGQVNVKNIFKTPITLEDGEHGWTSSNEIRQDDNGYFWIDPLCILVLKTQVSCWAVKVIKTEAGLRVLVPTNAVNYIGYESGPTKKLLPIMSMLVEKSSGSCWKHGEDCTGEFC